MVRKAMPWAELVLFLAGLSCLAATLWVVSEGGWFQWQYRNAGSAPAPAGAEPSPGEALGRIEIPRVGVEAVILEGVEARTLRRGVGHIPGTAFPGSGGRVALAAHRDTFFRNLRLIRAGDRVMLIARGRTKEYRVEHTLVVKPWQTEVLRPVGEDVVTLLTCFPFTYLGPAPDRFVVQARRVGEDTPLP